MMIKYFEGRSPRVDVYYKECLKDKCRTIFSEGQDLSRLYALRYHILRQPHHAR